jgi:tRNA-2-methylthio-N6-dimethylallyladenosine synthase
MSTYFIKTFGCAMNISDSERIASSLEKLGFAPAQKMEDAQLVVFNTCGIRQTAENRAYSMIHSLKLKAKSEKLKIIVTGCLANRKDVQKRLKDKVDLFTEIQDFPKLISSILYNVSSMNSKIRNTRYKIPDTKNSFDKEAIDYLTINPKHTNKFQAYIPIMTGCNNFCSYCVVPYARGREVSRSHEEIVSEVKNLVSKGYKEITLLGQNVNSYKSKVRKVRKSVKLEEEINFSKLLEIINKIPGKFWISFVSSHPKDFDDELIETTAKCQKVCEWVHLPIQSGNDKILKKMNRRYTEADYLRLIKKIRAAFKKYKPDSLYSISSDIIVGFPSETKKQFLDSAAVMEKSKFDMVFFGQFSPRPGTVAWQMKDNVTQKEKIRREKYLNEILKKTAFENNKKYSGKTLDVLIDKEKKGNYFGHTRTMKNVKIESDKKGLIGRIIKVTIIKANIWNLEGKTK